MRLKTSILLLQLLCHGICKSQAFNESEKKNISNREDDRSEHSNQDEKRTLQSRGRGSSNGKGDNVHYPYNLQYTIDRGRAQSNPVKDTPIDNQRRGNYYYLGNPTTDPQVITYYRTSNTVTPYTVSTGKAGKGGKATQVQRGGSNIMVNQGIPLPGSTVVVPGTNVQYYTQPGSNILYYTQPGSNGLYYTPVPAPVPVPLPAPAPGTGMYSPKGTKCLSRATRFKFQFTPTSCAASTAMNFQGGKFVPTIDTPLMSPALIKVIGPGSNEIFSGLLSFYDTFEINSSQGFDSVTVQIWKPDATQILQSFEFRTSCDDPLLLGDSFCGLTVGGFQNVPQGFVQMMLPGNNTPISPPISPPTTPNNPNTGVQCTDSPSQLKFKVTGDTCDASKNSQGINFSCTDYQSITFPAHVTITSVDNQIVYFQGIVQNKNDIVVIGDSINTCADRMTVITRSADQLQIKQLFSFATDCSVSLSLQDTFGNLQLVQFKNTKQGEFYCCMVPPTASMPPTKSPTNLPTKSPTNLPTKSPTNLPTRSPSKLPTKSPTNLPTKSPTNLPTRSPTSAPTRSPTKAPTRSPTNLPTRSPTSAPTVTPTSTPSLKPSVCATKCLSFSCQYRFEVLANGNCDNSVNEQTSAYFICATDGPLQFPFKATVYDHEFTTIFHRQDVTSPGEIISVGNENLCPPGIGVQMEGVDGTLYKLFTINTSCETAPISIGDTFSALKVVGFINDKQGDVSCPA